MRKSYPTVCSFMKISHEMSFNSERITGKVHEVEIHSTDRARHSSGRFQLFWWPLKVVFMRKNPAELNFSDPLNFTPERLPKQNEAVIKYTGITLSHLTSFGVLSSVCADYIRVSGFSLCRSLQEAAVSTTSGKFPQVKTHGFMEK